MNENMDTRSTAITRSHGAADHIFMTIIYIITLGSLVIVGGPMLHVCSASLSDPDAVLQGKIYLWPVGVTLQAYQMVFQLPAIWRGYANSIFYTALGTVISLAVTIMAAFPMSRKDLIGRRSIMLFFTFTMFFGGGLIPTYMVVMKLGLINKIWSFLIPGAMGVWNMIIMRTFFQNTVPEELYEATMLDGGKDFTYLFRVLLPLSKAVIAVMALMFAVGRWNSYFPEMIYLNDTVKMPLQVILRRILVVNDMSAGLDRVTDVITMERAKKMSTLLKYALIVVASVPVMILYPLAQKYFMQGVLIGSIKG